MQRRFVLKLKRAPEIARCKSKNGGDAIQRPATITEGDAYRLELMLEWTDAQIWRLACETGARISDILALTCGQLCGRPLTYREQKTRKKRTVRLSDALHEELLRWHGHRDVNALAYFSPRSMSKPLNRSTYYRRLKKASKTLQIRVSAHSARKLYARRVYTATGSIQAVQASLGHKYITTTATYLDIDIERLILDAALET